MCVFGLRLDGSDEAALTLRNAFSNVVLCSNALFFFLMSHFIFNLCF